MIVEVNGGAVPTIDRLVDVLAAGKPVDELQLGVVRGAKWISVNVELGRRS